MPHLGEGGKSLDAAIGSMVKKGLPGLVQAALASLRVVGGRAVPPGEISLDDTPEVARALFLMVNYLVDDRISRPRGFDELLAGLSGKVEGEVEHQLE